jgi:anti-sigma B factor antagonist
MIDQDGIKIVSKKIDKDLNIVLVNLSGYVDQANVYLLQEIIDQNFGNQNYNIIFDLKNLVYMSSAGWGVLVGEIKRLREKGGDLKLLNMSPEIYEIYQMLEFYHLISEFTSLEDALKSFVESNQEKYPNYFDDKETIQNIDDSIIKNSGKEQSENRDIPQNSSKQYNKKVEKDTIGEEQFIHGKILEQDHEYDQHQSMDAQENFTGNTKLQNERYIEFSPEKVEKELDIKMLPLNEKVRYIISQFPEFGIRQIRRALREEDYGNVKINLLKLKSLLKELELDTKEKRHRFYRSC